MLRLVSLNGENTTQSLYRSHPVYPSIGKYLIDLKKNLGVDAEMAKLDSNGSRFELLKALSRGKNYVTFEDSIYIPMNNKNMVWGFVKIKNAKDLSLKTIMSAIKGLDTAVPSDLYTGLEVNYQENRLIAMVLGVKDRSGYKLVLDHFHNDKYCSFINLSEWINLKQPFSLKYLREFRNSLFYINELMDLTRTQRATLALYSMLPPSIQQSSLVVTSKYTEDEIKKSLSQEKGFLNAFLNKKIELKEIKIKRSLS